jgi:hypothetical protein
MVSNKYMSPQGGSEVINVSGKMYWLQACKWQRVYRTKVCQPWWTIKRRDRCC